MEKGSTVLVISFLILINFASQSSASVGEFAERRQLRPHLQVQQELDGKKGPEIQSPSRRLGLGHGVSTVEMKHHGRMVTGHKGGSMGGGGAGGGAAGGTGGRNVGGGGAVTRPHNSKNGAAALPVPAMASVLALTFGCGVALSALSF